MNHSNFPKNNGKTIEEDFLNLTLSITTPLPPSDAATATTLPPDCLSLSSLSIASPSPNLASLPLITPQSSKPYQFDPTLEHQRIWYNQHTVVGSPSYVPPVGSPWFPSYHQIKEIGHPWVPQPTFVGPSSSLSPTTDPSRHQSTAIRSQPNPQSTTVRGPSQPRTTVARLRSARKPVRDPLHEIRGKICKKRMQRQTTIRYKPGKIKTIPPPYPWATEHRAIIHNLKHIQSKGIKAIAGKVRCTECHREFEIEYDLKTKFKEVRRFVIENKEVMKQRAPEVWRSPAVPDCKFCNQKKCAKPIWGKRREINWLFLLLGQMIGCCKLAELKYFCKHTMNHRTGAKDRVLYLTYLDLCRQLDPEGDYDL